MGSFWEKNIFLVQREKSQEASLSLLVRRKHVPLIANAPHFTGMEESSFGMKLTLGTSEHALGPCQGH